MKKLLFLVFMALALGSGWLGGTLSGTKSAQFTAAPPASSQNAFARMERTKTLRCGYHYYPPYIEKDLRTGKLAGFNVDLMEVIGQKLGVKIEWTEEVNNGTMMEGLNTGRYDALCIMVWQTPVRSMHANFSIPFGYTPIYSWVRANNKALSGDQAELNNANVRISAMDGEISDNLAHSLFPQAKIVAIPQGSPYADSFMNVITGKADVYFAEENFALGFLKNNPGSIRKLSEQPLIVFPMTLALPHGDTKLKTAIDTALAEIIYSPQYDRILAHYGGLKELGFKKPAMPYQN